MGSTSGIPGCARVQQQDWHQHTAHFSLIIHSLIFRRAERRKHPLYYRFISISEAIGQINELLSSSPATWGPKRFETAWTDTTRLTEPQWWEDKLVEKERKHKYDLSNRVEVVMWCGHAGKKSEVCRAKTSAHRYYRWVMTSNIQWKWWEILKGKKWAIPHWSRHLYSNRRVFLTEARKTHKQQQW